MWKRNRKPEVYPKKIRLAKAATQDNGYKQMEVRDGSLGTPRQYMHKERAHNHKHSSVDMAENPENANIEGFRLQTF